MTNGGWLPGGSCPGRRYDLETGGYIIDFGGDDFIALPTLIGKEKTDKLTIEVWFKPDSPSSGWQPLVNQWLNSAAFSLNLVYGEINFRTQADVLAGGVFYTQNISTNRWHHLVAVYDGSIMRVYLDGVRSSSEYPQSGKIDLGYGSTYTGVYGEAHYDGKIDELRIYKSALTDEEVSARFQKLLDNQLAASATFQESYNERMSTIGSSIYCVSPNPFNGTTTIRYAVNNAGPVKIALYDVSGRALRILLNDPHVERGEYSLVWDGQNGAGRRVASGVYFCRLDSAEGSSSKKILYLR
jgi:hypothetical protein